MKDIEHFKLYGGGVDLVFDPDRHVYLVNDQPVDGTTSVLSILAKPALISWASKMAAEHVFENLKPGVALDELQIRQLCDDAKNAHRKKKKAAGDCGSLVHEYAENYLSGIKQPLPVNPEVLNGVKAFLQWHQEHDVRFVKTEFKIYSQKLGYAGTSDLLATVDGKLTLADYKTGSGIYPEMGLQLAAYRMAMEEEDPSLKIESMLIINIRKDGGLETREFPEYVSEKAAFLAALELWRWQKKNK